MARVPAAPPRAWQRMLSGRRLDLIDPSPFDIEIEDIAHGLARVARWNGQTRGAHIFSVAQHSLLVEAVARQLRTDLPARTLLAILLHDAAEYVIGDMISPLKAMLNDSYKAVELRILAAVMVRFGLPPAPSREVLALTKQADAIAAYHEAVTLAGFEEQEAERFFGRRVALPHELVAMLEPWSASEAKERYLARVVSILPHA